jgi:hypothetical protein
MDFLKDILEVLKNTIKGKPILKPSIAIFLISILISQLKISHTTIIVVSVVTLIISISFLVISRDDKIIRFAAYALIYILVFAIGAGIGLGTIYIYKKIVEGSDNKEIKKDSTSNNTKKVKEDSTKVAKEDSTREEDNRVKIEQVEPFKRKEIPKLITHNLPCKNLFSIGETHCNDIVEKIIKDSKKNKNVIKKEVEKYKEKRREEYNKQYKCEESITKTCTNEDYFKKTKECKDSWSASTGFVIDSVTGCEHFRLISENKQTINYSVINDRSEGKRIVCRISIQIKYDDTTIDRHVNNEIEYIKAQIQNELKMDIF